MEIPSALATEISLGRSTTGVKLIRLRDVTRLPLSPRFFLTADESDNLMKKVQSTSDATTNDQETHENDEPGQE